MILNYINNSVYSRKKVFELFMKKYVLYINLPN